MSYRQLSIHGIKIRTLETCDIWKVVDYLESYPRNVERVFCQLLRHRFAPLVVEKSDPKYKRFLVSSFNSLTGWEKLIRQHCRLEPCQYYNSFELLNEENSSSEDSITDKDISISEDVFNKIIYYIENHLETRVDDVIIETACARYLPFALKEDDPRFRSVANESASACEIWAGDIRTYAGLPLPIPIPPAPMNMMPYSNMQQVQATLPPVVKEESVADNPETEEVEENVTSQESEKIELPTLSWNDDNDWMNFN